MKSLSAFAAFVEATGRSYITYPGEILEQARKYGADSGGWDCDYCETLQFDDTNCENCGAARPGEKKPTP